MKRVLCLLICLLSLCSCEGLFSPQNLRLGGMNIVCYNRECNAVNVAYTSLPDNNNYLVIGIAPKKGDALNYDGNAFNNQEKALDPDFIMEEQIIDFYENHPKTKGTPWDVGYRTEELINLLITADCTLFGIPPGQSLNEKFVIFSTCGGATSIISWPFFFTYDKRMVIDNIQGMSLSKFLSYRPLAPAATYLSLIETPSETPIEVTFKVTVTIKDKEPFSGYTTITLR